MFVHWRGSPLPLALFPPPSITPRTASMPRSAFRRARLRVSFAERLCDVEAILSRADGDVALQAAMAILPSDQERILAAAPDRVPADDVVAAADRRPIECEVDPGPRGPTMLLRATRLPCPFSIAMPSPPFEMRFRAITFLVPGQRGRRQSFERSGCAGSVASWKRSPSSEDSRGCCARTRSA